jgi:hypothetical protein
MISPDVPTGHVDPHVELRYRGAGGPATRGVISGQSLGLALQSDHAGTFGVNVIRVPIDSAAVFPARVHRLHDRAGRLAAPARG